MFKLSTKPYKGARDYYPEDKRVQNYIFSVWKNVVESFGYEEYNVPLLEPVEIYKAKSGQELIDDQTYSFKDRGDRLVAIRPEMTPSVSRLVAAKRHELPIPIRLFNISNFYRYERPQKGRDREFWQLNVDIFGVDSDLADLEILNLSHKLLAKFGAKNEMFTIKINDRRLIDFILQDYIKLNSTKSKKVMGLIDKKDKISAIEFKEKLIEIVGENDTSNILKKISKFIGAKNYSDLPEEITQSDQFKKINNIIDELKSLGIGNCVLDLTLMRGLDYYTGMVFEIYDNDPDNNRSLFGGGRYDGLIDLFGEDALSAVGFAPGYSTTEIFLKNHKLLPVIRSKTEIYVITLTSNNHAINEIVTQLRDEGVRAEIDITDRKIDKKIKTAIKKSIPFILFIGDDEIKNNIYTLKEIASSLETKLSIERIITQLKDYRVNPEDNEDIFDL